MSAQIAVLVIQIGIILLIARLFGIVAAKLKIPSVMGELLAGIIIGPYCLGGIPLPLKAFGNGLFPIISAQTIPLDPKLYGIAIIGSIILLFISGLETDVRTFFKYSVVGTIVGIGGIVCSFICGAAVGMFALGWEFMDPRCLFLGILCTATSVGISARILSEHRAMSSPEGVTIMAAAVIDDVLGIVCLAIVVGIANVELTGTKMAWGPILWITVKSFGIWLGVTAIGLLISRKIADFLKIFKSAKVFAVLAFGFALMLAGLFEQAGLAMIVGAFVMGLSLSKTDISFKIRSSLDPLYNFFVPIFFVVMGMLVDIRVLKDPEVLKVGLIFSFMAIIGKVVGCFFPSLLMNFNSVGALRVGVGMVPRCEVVLIIAGIAATTMMKNPELEELEKKPDAVAQIMELKTPLPHEVPIFNSKLFGIAIIMPLVTALLAPPLLSMTLAIKKKGVRKEVKDNNDTITKYTFPSEAIKLFVLNELIELLDNEGYMHSTYSKGINIIQFRREDISFTLQINGTEFIFTSAPSEVPLIKTCIYESVVELHQVLSDLKNLTKPQTLKDDLFGDKQEEQPAVLPPPKTSASMDSILAEQNIVINLKNNTKEGIFHELLDVIKRNNPSIDTDVCFQNLLERESVISTYAGDSIAMPHARTTGTNTFIAAMGLKPQGVNYDEGEDHLAKIFILSLCPKDEPGPYLEFITHVSQVLSDAEKREKLVIAKTPEEARKIMVS